jgi:hypothetical protein
MHDLEWALAVLEQFPADRIIPAQQAPVIRNLNLANILLEQKKYPEALKTLGAAKKFRQIKELHYRLLANRLYAKILFEIGDLGDYDGRLFLKTTRAWIQREKDLKESRQDSNDAFFDFSAQIFRLKNTDITKPGGYFEELRTLASAIKKSKPAEYEWLSQKIEQLGASLVKDCIKQQDFALAEDVVYKVFGGYTRTLRIRNTEARNQMLICTAQLLYELNWLKLARKKMLIRAATAYLKNASGLNETDQKEYISFLERLQILSDIRNKKDQTPEARQSALDLVQARIFRAIEDKWIKEKINELFQ